MMLNLERSSFWREIRWNVIVTWSGCSGSTSWLRIRPGKKNNRKPVAEAEITTPNGRDNDAFLGVIGRFSES